MKDLPNLLTVFRIALIPAFCGSFYFQGTLSWMVTTGIFAVASLTDFFDGYLARTLKAQSRFGKLFDPIADKMIIASAILMLVHLNYIEGIHLIPAITIICREFLISGLREYLAHNKKTMPVNRLGKLKTILQIVAMLLYLIDKEWIPKFLANSSLWMAGIASVASAYSYLYENREVVSSNKSR